MKHENILTTIGNTPLVNVSKMFMNRAEVWLKLERANPGGSIKDRIALAMVEKAEDSGILAPGSTIIEPTSGNTGIGLAMVAAVKKYSLIIVMPESMSMERRALLRAYGAKLVLTPALKGMTGAIEKARELHEMIENSWMPGQFENCANPNIHMEVTAAEILNDFPDGIDSLIAGVGTGGHITGLGCKLKQVWPDLSVIAVEPSDSAVLSGKSAGSHKIQGIGAGFISKVTDPDIIDSVVPVTYQEAIREMQQLARREGILAGISTGANLAAVRKKIDDNGSAIRLLTFAYDTGERYLGNDMF